MKVIGVVGLPASGKGEFSCIAQEAGIPVVVMGDVIRDAVQEAGLPVTDENLGACANRLRRDEGMDAIARRCIPCIEALGAQVVLVDGIRGDSEVDLFRAHFSRFYLIGIDAPFDLRLKRLSSRGRADDKPDRDTLRARDRREIGWGLGRALSHADYTIENSGALEKFGNEVRALIEEIRGEP